MSFLDKLKDNQETILLAEIGTLFHDIGKANEKFIEKHAKNGKNSSFYHNLVSLFIPSDLLDFLKNHYVAFCRKSVSLLEIIEKHHKEQINGKDLEKEDVPLIIRLLYPAWHGYDGIDSGSDKGQLENKEIVGQNKEKTSVANAFGFESELHQLSYFQAKRKEILNIIIEKIQNCKDIVSFREKIIDIIHKYYLSFLGDTRRPSNDVTLWDHSYSVASMFKCAVAKNLIDCSNPSYNALDFKWNFLSINIDILLILSKGIKLGDIIKYYETIESNYNKCKKFIEIDYPIGNEIYRDSTGIYFLVIELNQTQLEEIKKRLIQNLEPELMTSINYKSSNLPNSNIGKQKQEDMHKKEFLKIFKTIKKRAQNELKFPSSFKRFTSDAYNQDWNDKEICPVCQLKPKPRKNELCKECDKNRIKTAKIWLDEGSSNNVSIWIDEISDQNNQVTAIFGKFNLDRWLNGEYIETLVVNKSYILKTNDLFKKNPSPSRIRRCWETTHNFIKDTIISKILNEFFHQEEGSSDINLRTRRIAFKIRSSNIDLEVGSAVDIKIDGNIISPVCIDNNEGIFLTTHNLKLTPNWGKNESEILDFLNDSSRIVKVKSENGNSWRDQEFNIKAIPVPDSRFITYLPYLSIFTFPDQFIILVPANQALDIISKIMEEYEIQFGKVIDRLPLHLGIIGFHRKTPLNLLMEAISNWLDRIKEREKKKGNLEAEICGKEMNSLKCNLILKCDDYSSKKFSWQVPLRMGDPDVEDFWYPYFRVKGKMSSDRSLCYAFENTSYCCHIKDIKQGDIILFDPSYFSLEYLDQASKRWRIGKELHSLNDFIRLQSLWDIISKKLENRTWSMSDLYAYWQETSKIEESINDFDLKRQYIKVYMKNVLKLSENQNAKLHLFETILETTQEGLLDLCLFWNLKIRKFKPT